MNAENYVRLLEKKKIKDGVNKWKDMLCSWTGKNQHSEYVNSPPILIWQNFYQNSRKVPLFFLPSFLSFPFSFPFLSPSFSFLLSFLLCFERIDYLKMYMERPRNFQLKQFWKTKSTQIQNLLYSYYDQEYMELADRWINRKRIENSEIHPYKYIQLTFDKSAETRKSKNWW